MADLANIINLAKTASGLVLNQKNIAFFKEDGYKKNNVVIFNFEADDLKSEYQRIKSLKIGKVSQIMYVNIHMPYYYFNVIDPDGNILEITGSY